MYEHDYVYTCVCACAQKPEVNNGCLLLALSTIFFETGPTGLSCTPSAMTMDACHHAFMWVQWTQTLVLVVSWQAFNPLSHLHSPQAINH